MSVSCSARRQTRRSHFRPLLSALRTLRLDTCGSLFFLAFQHLPTIRLHHYRYHKSLKAKDEWAKRQAAEAEKRAGTRSTFAAKYGNRDRSPRVHSSVPRADFFESKGDDAAAALAGLSVKRLISLAAAQDIDISTFTEKTDIVAHLASLGVTDDPSVEHAPRAPPAVPRAAASASPPPPPAAPDKEKEKENRNSPPPFASKAGHSPLRFERDESPPAPSVRGDDDDDKKIPSYMRGTKASQQRAGLRRTRRSDLEEEARKIEKARSQSPRPQVSGPTAAERAERAAAAARERFEKRAADLAAKKERGELPKAPRYDPASGASSGAASSGGAGKDKSPPKGGPSPPPGRGSRGGGGGDDRGSASSPRSSSPRSSRPTPTGYGSGSGTSGPEQRSESPRTAARRSSQSGGGGGGTWSKPSQWQAKARREAQESAARESASAARGDARPTAPRGRWGGDPDDPREDRGGTSPRGASTTRGPSSPRGQSVPPPSVKRSGNFSASGGGGGNTSASRGRERASAARTPVKGINRARSTSTGFLGRGGGGRASSDDADGGGGPAGPDGLRPQREFTAEERMPIKCARVAREYVRVWLITTMASDRDLRSAKIARKVIDDSEFSTGGTSQAKYRKLMRLVHPDSLVTLKGSEPSTAVTLVMAASLLRTYNAANEILARPTEADKANSLAPPPCLAPKGDYPNGVPSARKRNAVLAAHIFAGAEVMLLSPAVIAANAGRGKNAAPDRLMLSVQALREINKLHRAGFMADMLNEEKKRDELEKAAAKAAAKRAELEAKVAKDAARRAEKEAAERGSGGSGGSGDPASLDLGARVDAQGSPSSPKAGVSFFAGDDGDLDAPSGTTI